MRYESSVEIAAPADIVWRVMSDVERWPEWTRSERSAELEEKSRPFGVGSRARLEAAGSRMKTTWEVTHLEPGRSFIWESSQPGMRTVAGHYIEPSAAGSRVRLTIDMSGALSVLLRPYLAYVARRNVAWEAEGLKRRSEEIAAGP